VAEPPRTNRRDLAGRPLGAWVGRVARRIGTLFGDALHTLSVRPWRALGMVSGVVVGVGAGVVTLGFTAAEEAQVLAQFDRQLSPVAVVEGPSRVDAVRSPLSPLDADVEGTLATAPGVFVGGELTTWTREALVRPNAYTAAEVAPVFGVTSGGLDAAGVELVAGRDLAAGLVGDDPVVWVGEQLAGELGLLPLAPTGRVVVVDGVELSVAGFTSGAARYPALSRSIVMSSAVAARLWPEAEQPRVLAHVRRGSSAVASDHLLLLLDPTGGAGLADQTPSDGGALRGEVNADVRRAGLALSALALGIGVISVANVLSISVLERTREFGLRSALGWPMGRIARLVMIEATTAGVVASIIGTALGLAVWRVLCVTNDWEPVLPELAVWLPATGGLAAALLGGIAPALRAGFIDPVDALRS
jgi:cell division protein FtsX